MRQAGFPESLISHVLAVADAAGAAILELYGANDADLQEKEDGSPLTAADLAAHRCIAQGLRALDARVPVVSEEDHGRAIGTARTGPWWLVDPLDGTREFLARNGEFTVNIAYVEDGVALFGVVHAPALARTYWGGAGFGSFRRTRHGGTEPIRVGERRGDPMRVVASKSHLNAETRLFIDGLGAVDLVQAGSSLKFCKLAEGEADLYPRLAPTCEWDTAAAQAVLEGAGGCVVDLAGQPLRYGKGDPLNPSFIARAWIP
jgi:3'(2'), 5'-bisphosphate nucleotidase